MEFILAKYVAELVAVISITILTIITPGPDFIVVAKNSLSYSRRSGIFTAMGVASAVWIHIFYTLAGIGVILSTSIVLFSIVKYLGAAYLIYLGMSSIRSKGGLEMIQGDKSTTPITAFRSYRMGFINNALNPKATLFFVSLFTQLVSPSTPLSIQIIYGAIVSLSCLIWFSLVAVFLNRSAVKSAFLRAQKTVEKMMGTVLIGFGVKVALATNS
ncbi:LysE family transporter [Thaumasiovibrio sp. DFM-14]|uniref:LysE family transporter n=1 Tax=Thaumasiovibrio sp. DFM-14 TaxID=3384792 RepID=UPI0039A3A002